MSDSTEPAVSDTEEVIQPDPVLIAAGAEARAALAEITPAETIGAEVGSEVHEERVLSLYFECLLPGYPGWRWSATLTRVDDASPITVLEVELLPGEGAVIAPEWVPWSVRLAQYRETQSKLASDEAVAAEAAAAELADEDEVDPEDDLLENDFSDFDDELDGVDVEDDELDDDGDADDESDDSDDDESDDDDSDDDFDDEDDDEFDHLDDDDEE